MLKETTEKNSKFELENEEITCYKGIRYIVKHTYQNSGENLMNVLKKQLLKTLESLDITESEWYNEDVNIFG